MPHNHLDRAIAERLEIDPTAKRVPVTNVDLGDINLGRGFEAGTLTSVDNLNRVTVFFDLDESTGDR